MLRLGNYKECFVAQVHCPPSKMLGSQFCFVLFFQFLDYMHIHKEVCWECDLGINTEFTCLTHARQSCWHTCFPLRYVMGGQGGAGISYLCMSSCLSSNSCRFGGLWDDVVSGWGAPLHQVYDLIFMTPNPGAFPYVAESWQVPISQASCLLHGGFVLQD